MGLLLSLLDIFAGCHIALVQILRCVFCISFFFCIFCLLIRWLPLSLTASPQARSLHLFVNFLYLVFYFVFCCILLYFAVFCCILLCFYVFLYFDQQLADGGHDAPYTCNPPAEEMRASQDFLSHTENNSFTKLLWLLNRRNYLCNTQTFIEACNVVPGSLVSILHMNLGVPNLTHPCMLHSSIQIPGGCG